MGGPRTGQHDCGGRELEAYNSTQHTAKTKPMPTILAVTLEPTPSWLHHPLLVHPRNWAESLKSWLALGSCTHPTTLGRSLDLSEHHL